MLLFSYWFSCLGLVLLLCCVFSKCSLVFIFPLVSGICLSIILSFFFISFDLTYPVFNATFAHHLWSLPVTSVIKCLCDVYLVLYVCWSLSIFIFEWLFSERNKVFIMYSLLYQCLFITKWILIYLHRSYLFLHQHILR